MNGFLITRRAALLATAAALSGCASLGPEPGGPAGRRVEIIRRGAGQPTLVMEAGLGFGASDWGGAPTQLIGLLSGTSSVFAYSRPGYGGTPATGAPRDPASIARELRELLASQGVAPPFVLVGHSIGGLYAMVFAAMHRNETAGLVLIDPTHPRQWSEMQQRAPRDATIVSALALTFSATMRQEFEASKAFPAVLATPYAGPVGLLVAQRPDPLASAAFVQLRSELMADLAATYRVAPIPVASGHFIHKEQPNIVAAAVRKVIEAARRG
jgi:pimeloyl-ACP methyl ester carboxylesterase